MQRTFTLTLTTYNSSSNSNNNHRIFIPLRFLCKRRAFSLLLWQDRRTNKRLKTRTSGQALVSKGMRGQRKRKGNATKGRYIERRRDEEGERGTSTSSNRIVCPLDYMTVNPFHRVVIPISYINTIGYALHAYRFLLSYNLHLYTPFHSEKRADQPLLLGVFVVRHTQLEHS